MCLAYPSAFKVSFLPSHFEGISNAGLRAKTRIVLQIIKLEVPSLVADVPPMVVQERWLQPLIVMSDGIVLICTKLPWWKRDRRRLGRRLLGGLHQRLCYLYPAPEFGLLRPPEVRELRVFGAKRADMSEGVRPQF